ncbi:MAG: sulfotransferase domain-containing protein [Leptospirales bacterium]
MESVLVYSVNKAASMFLHKISNQISKKLELPYFSMNNDFREEIKPMTWRKFIENNKRIGIYGPIRASQGNIYPDNLNNYRIILHLRDPRDVMVSKYYSKAYNHPKREGGFSISDESREQLRKNGIDDFVINNPQSKEIKSHYESYIKKLIGQKNVTFVKYETMVTDYSTWVRHFLKPFNDFYAQPDELYSNLYNEYKNDFNVSKENIYEHKRQILPGDFKKKLSPETIQFINHQLSDILKFMNYEI